CYISSYLNSRGFETYIYDAEFNPKGEASITIKEVSENIELYLNQLNNLENSLWQEIIRDIKSFSFDIVGISVKTATFKAGLNIAKICKEINPNSIIIFGGPHIACLPEDSIKYDYIDYGVIGEGEITMSELLKSLEKGEEPNNVKGIIYKKNGKIIKTSPREPIKHLDELPIPDHENIINGKKYPPETHGEIITGRGCPYLCIFCASNKIWGRNVRFRSPEKVVDEIEYIKNKFGTNYFYIEDDTFTLKKSFAIEICNEIVKRKLDIKFSCETRANLLDKELVKKLKMAGCDDISIGVESGSDETLEKIKKGINKNEIKNAFSIIKDVGGIKTSAFVMVGFPWEKRENMINTIEFAKSLKPDRLIFSIVTPYPGTELFDYCERNHSNRLPKTEAWEEFFHQSGKINLTELSKDDFEKTIRYLEEMILKYMARKRIKDKKFLISRLKTYIKNPKKFISDLKIISSY
ncbi:MAG: radical SAM protein, partial [Candidatus Methanomethylicia archaeon]